MSDKNQTAVEWYWDKIKSHFEHDGDLYEVACMTYEIAKEKEKEQSSIWYETNPEKDGDYICRMDNAYIKLCHYKDGLWFDMWKGDIDRQVKEWMNIPYNK
jgi:hypothetical protein